MPYGKDTADAAPGPWPDLRAYARQPARVNFLTPSRTLSIIRTIKPSRLRPTRSQCKFEHCSSHLCRHKQVWKRVSSQGKIKLSKKHKRIGPTKGEGEGKERRVVRVGVVVVVDVVGSGRVSVAVVAVAVVAVVFAVVVFVVVVVVVVVVVFVVVVVVGCCCCCWWCCGCRSGFGYCFGSCWKGDVAKANAEDADNAPPRPAQLAPRAPRLGVCSAMLINLEPQEQKI